MALIEARGVSKHFGRRKVLAGLDLRVEDGEIVALMGPNGAGKTTLLRILATLLEPSEGQVLIDGWNVRDDPTNARRSIGFVGHSTYSYDELTALENLRFYWSMNSLPREDFRAAATELLRRVGLAHRMHDRVSVFSRGMRQRLAIARALINSPRILLFDEPFSSLDLKGAEVLGQILDEERGRGCSVLLVAHELGRISRLVDRVDVLVGGRISASFDGASVRRGDLEPVYRAAAGGAVA